MTQAEWNEIAAQTAQWIREDEAAGQYEAAQQKRDVIWQLYDAITETE